MGQEQGQGVGCGGAGGVKGGTWKFPKLGPTHRWLSVGGRGVYVCMYVTYICTYIHFSGIKSSFNVDLPMGP